jgi:hypothetical protein
MMHLPSESDVTGILRTLDDDDVTALSGAQVRALLLAMMKTVKEEIHNAPNDRDWGTPGLGQSRQSRR